MINILSISLLLPHLIAADAQLGILIQQSREQINEIQKLIKAQNVEIQQIEQLQRNLTELDSQVFQVLKQFEGDPSYDRALIEIQAENENQLLKLESPKSENKLEPEDRRKKVNQFQDASLFANKEDLNKIESLKNLPADASPADVARVNLFAQISQWEAIVRLSSQTAQLLQALHQISEKLEKEENRKILSDEEINFLQSAARRTPFQEK